MSSSTTNRVLIGALIALVMMVLPSAAASAGYHGVTTLTSPADGATGIALTSDLTWTGPPGARYYMIEIFTPSNGWSATFFTTTPSITFKLDPLITWSWHVASSHNKGRAYGPWSETWTFTTASDSPSYSGVATSPSPADGANGIALTSLFTWAAPSGANYYMIKIFTPSNGWSATFFTATPSITFKLDPLITWYWHVASSPDSGATWGPWSETWTFTTGSDSSTYSGVATSPSPTDGAFGIALTSDLTWTAPADANYYMIEIFTPSNGWSRTFFTATPSITFTLDPLTTWSWHVASSPDSGATWGPYSETWTFTTGQ